MSLMERREEQSYLTRKDRLREAFRLCQQNLEVFSQLMAKRWETKKFVSDMAFKMHPFLEGRRELARTFLEGLSRKQRERFIEAYLNLEEDQRKLLDTFARNYARYNRHWRVRIPPPEGLEVFIRTFHLKKTPTSLAFFAFDHPLERRRFYKIATIYNLPFNNLQPPGHPSAQECESVVSQA